MATKAYPDFDGWTVEHDANRGRFFFAKDHPAGKPGPEGTPRLTVVAAGADPDAVYLAGKRDCYLEERRVATDAERSAVQSNLDAAERAVVEGKVKRALASGGGEDKARERLEQAGMTATEAAAFVAEHGG